MIPSHIEPITFFFSLQYIIYREYTREPLSPYCRIPIKALSSFFLVFVSYSSCLAREKLNKKH